MDDKNKQIRELRKSTAKDLEILLEAQEQGLIPLFFFIETVASEPAINKLKKGITLPKLPKDHLSKVYPPKVYPFKGVINLEGFAREAKLFELEQKRSSSYRAILTQIKNDILNNTLVIRDIDTLCPLNNASGMKSWCKDDDTFKSIELMQPHKRITLKIEDAVSWLNNNGMPIPDWLASMIKNTETEKPSKTVEDRIIECLISEGYTPLKLPPYTNGKPGVKAYIRKKLNIDIGTFNRKWQELLNNQKIAYASE